MSAKEAVEAHELQQIRQIRQGAATSLGRTKISDIVHWVQRVHHEGNNPATLRCTYVCEFEASSGHLKDDFLGVKLIRSGGRGLLKMHKYPKWPCANSGLCLSFSIVTMHPSWCRIQCAHMHINNRETTLFTTHHSMAICTVAGRCRFRNLPPPPPPRTVL